MDTISRLAKRFGLSRATLLYYDRIGVLRPWGRTAAGYRLYSPAEVERLEAVRRYRQVGLPLAETRKILDGPRDAVASALERRVDAVNAEIARLREQQRVLLRLLQTRSTQRRTRALDKRRWVKLLRKSGMTEADMHRWHVQFEQTEPEAHQDFLESLGIEPEEIARIRAASRGSKRKRGR
ncbi:MAG: MerR family transcriptional regulator [Myxococcales bacterium]|nr:MerR family transcriptional regulator [Myxococcales bacterium]